MPVGRSSHLDNNALKDLLLRSVEAAKGGSVGSSPPASLAELPELVPSGAVLHPALQQSGLRGAGRRNLVGLLLQGRGRAAPLPGHAALAVLRGAVARADAAELRAERRVAVAADQRGRHRVGVRDSLLLGAVPGDEERERAVLPGLHGVPGRGGVAAAGDGAALSAALRSAVDAVDAVLDDEGQ